MNDATTARGRRQRARWLLGQVALVVGGLVVYFGVRGLTESAPDVAFRNGRAVFALEQRLGIAHEAWAQGLVVDSNWLRTLANWVYIWGHWPVIALALFWLAVRHRPTYLRLRDSMVASGLVGIAIFTTYPVAPPRLAGLGLVDTITEQSESYRVLQPPGFVNQYAAMPSLHVGWDLLVGLAVASAVGVVWLRWLVRLMPALMAASVVVTANHYLLDVVAGVAVAMVGLAVALVVESRRSTGTTPSAHPRRLLWWPDRRSPAAPLRTAQHDAPAGL